MNEENYTGQGNNEDKLKNSEENVETIDQFEELSKSDAMSGIITEPGETFEKIAGGPKRNYWTYPVLIAVVLSLLSSFLFMRDPELSRNTMDKQKAKMMEKFEKNIKDGKMTQEEADEAIERMNPNGPFFKIIGYAGALIGPFLILLLLSLIYFIILKIMKSSVEFSSVLNVVGLAMLISSVGSILAILISIMKGNMTGVSPGIFLSEESIGEKVFSFLNKLDVFTIWFYVVISIGLTKVGRISMVKSATFVFGLFIIYTVITSLVF
ncbi:MAG TPA: Yip1 family protein [Ignavibacteria bacterium]|nr:Yip1 family protein [Ignavibacteria bacterium]HMR39501.1 Yip1 family protein [Ignavibacteria bacterium]